MKIIREDFLSQPAGVRKRLPCMWLFLGLDSEPGISCCEPKEWLVCNYVWHSSLCCTVCSVVAQELAPTPGQPRGPKSTLPHLVLSGDTVASVFSGVYWDLKRRVLWSVSRGLMDSMSKMPLILQKSGPVSQRPS